MDEDDKIKRLSVVLDQVMEISKISYTQESERSKQILNKSDFIIKYISAIFIFVNIFFPIIWTNKLVSISLLLVFYALISLPLVLSLYYSVRVQVLLPGSFFPTGKAVIEKMKQEKDRLNNIVKMKNRQINYYSSSTEKMQETNDRRAILLKRAYGFYLTSIGILLLSILVIMIIVSFG